MEICVREVLINLNEFISIVLVALQVRRTKHGVVETCSGSVAFYICDLAVDMAVPMVFDFLQDLQMARVGSIQ